MVDPFTVFAIGDIDELGIRGVVLRGTDPEAIREAGRNLHQPVVVVPVEQWKQVVEALTAAQTVIQEDRNEMFDAVTVAGDESTMSDIDRPHVERMDAILARIAAALSSIRTETEASTQMSRKEPPMNKIEELNEKALRALAQAYDREHSAQRGEPDPWNLDDFGDIGDSDTWVSERLACARVAAEAFLSAIEPAAPEGRQEAAAWPLERVNIPEPDNPSCRIVGFRIREGDEAWGTLGLSEPLFWLERMCQRTTPPTSEPEAENARLRERLAEALKALEPFSDMAGEMFARGWNASDVAIALDSPDGPCRVTAGDFFAARRAREGGRK